MPGESVGEAGWEGDVVLLRLMLMLMLISASVSVSVVLKIEDTIRIANITTLRGGYRLLSPVSCSRIFSPTTCLPTSFPAGMLIRARGLGWAGQPAYPVTSCYVSS